MSKSYKIKQITPTDKNTTPKLDLARENRLLNIRKLFISFIVHKNQKKKYIFYKLGKVLVE